ncbi:MAG: ribonuclease III [Candidatus Aminicenantes bacterium]
MEVSLSPLEKKIGYRFRNKNILLQALTHSSYAYENYQHNRSDNEVLEFLGDSVLSLIIADFLYKSYPDLSEGELSKLKSAAASTSSLSYFAQKISLDKKLLLGKGEEKSGGRKKKTILAGAFEALIAAIYLDGGLQAAKKFTYTHLRLLFKRIDVEKFFINNYKSALQEYLQRENLPAPDYKTLTTKGPDHKRSFVVEVLSEGKPLAKAKGPSKKSAEKKAAQKALKNLLGKKMKALTTDTFLLKKKK